MRRLPAKQPRAVIVAGILFDPSMEWLEAGQVFGSAFMVVEHDDAVRLVRERCQHVVLVAEVDEDHVLTGDVWRLLPINSRHKLDIGAERLPDNPCSAEPVSAVAVVDAHRFALNLGHTNSSPAVHRQAVELGEGLLLGAALEVSAAHDHRLAVVRKRRHGAEGEVAAIAVSVGAGGAHATFGLVVHRHGPR